MFCFFKTFLCTTLSPWTGCRRTTKPAQRPKKHNDSYNKITTLRLSSFLCFCIPPPFFSIPSEWSSSPFFFFTRECSWDHCAVYACTLADDLLPSDAASGRVLRTLCVICPEEQRLTAWRHQAARPQGYRASGLSGHNLWGVGPFGLWMHVVATTLSADDMSRACRGTHVGLPLGCRGEFKVAAEVKKTRNNHNVMVKQSEGMFSTWTKAIIPLTSEAFLRYHHSDMRKAAAVSLVYYTSSHLPLPKARSYRMRVWIARMHYSSSPGICSEPHQPPASWIAWQSSQQ